MAHEPSILKALRSGELRLEPLKLALVRTSTVAKRSASPREAIVSAQWGKERLKFVVAPAAPATPKAIREALQRAKESAAASRLLPLVITAYLPPERLKELESAGVSGIDLCGNGIVIVPGRLLVYRTGYANRYPAGRRIRDVYRGASSQVARVFLLRPQFESVQAVHDEVAARGARVALSTVSKVLKVLEDDLIIGREGRASRLSDPGELLDRLAASFRAVEGEASGRYRWTGPRDELEQRLGEASPCIARTGAASVEEYAVMAREATVQCYCESIRTVVRHLGASLEETTRFADVELIETLDPTVYFDARRVGALPAASPIQCWLELARGDKRQQDAARTVRQRILEDLRKRGWGPS